MRKFVRIAALMLAAVVLAVPSMALAQVQYLELTASDDACINDFINRYRVKMAKKLMDETDMMVYEIAFAVGFSNQHYFSRTFKRITGLSPSEYKNHRQSAGISS